MGYAYYWSSDGMTSLGLVGSGGVKVWANAVE